MSARRDLEPAGGTTTPFVRWTSGLFDFGERWTTDDASDDELPKAYVPADFEAGIYERWLAADVFAPDGAGSRADRACRRS